jgi:hypothetical protein
MEARLAASLEDVRIHRDPLAARSAAAIGARAPRYGTVSGKDNVWWNDRICSGKAPGPP